MRRIICAACLIQLSVILQAMTPQEFTGDWQGEIISNGTKEKVCVQMVPHMDLHLYQYKSIYFTVSHHKR